MRVLCAVYTCAKPSSGATLTLCIVCSIMGDLSVIGTSTSLVVQGLVTARGLPPISFFDLAFVGAPALVCGTLYLCTYGYSALASIAKTKTGGTHAVSGVGEGKDTASATDYAAELVLIPRSSLVGKPVVLTMAHVFAGEGTVLRVLREHTGDPEGPADPVPLPAKAAGMSTPTRKAPSALAVSPSALSSTGTGTGTSSRRPSSATTSRRVSLRSQVEGSTASFRVVSPVTDEETFQEGDRIIVRAGEGGLLRAYSSQAAYGYRFSHGTPHPGSRDQRRYRALKTSLQSLLSAVKQRLAGVSGSPTVGPQCNAARVPSLPDLTAHQPTPVSDVVAEHAASGQSQDSLVYNGFQLLLSNTSPLIGQPVSSGTLERLYQGVTLLGVRLGSGNPHVDSFGSASTAVGSERDVRSDSEVITVDATVTEGSGLMLTGPEDAHNRGPYIARAQAYDLGSLTYAAGDCVLVTAQKDFALDYGPGKCKDFFMISRVAGASDIEPTGVTQVGSFLLLVAMFVVGSIGSIGGIPFEMEKAAMLAAGLNLVLGFVSPKEAYQVIQWDLVVLIGSSFGLGAAMESTGLAKDIAGGVVSLTARGGPHAALFMMYGVTLFLTELISNNAAATLTIPVAINMAKELGVRHQPFVLSICIACTAAFALPLGYQTHLMVMAPGRYSQRDFLKVGIGMDLIYWLVIAGLAPYVWPF